MQDVRLTNIGNTDLVFSAIQVPTAYNLGSSDTTCNGSTSLAVNGSCVFGITFVPTADGDLSNTMTITDDYANEPGGVQPIFLSGAGMGAVDAPAKLAFIGTIAPITAGGNLGTLIVDVDDANATLLTSATNAVTLTLTGPGGYSQTLTVTAVNGVASFNLSSLALTTPGTYTLTATSSGLTQAVATVTVTDNTASTPVQLSIPAASLPATLASGGSLGVLPVNINNSSGTLITSATNSVTLTITGPGGFSYTATVAAYHGIASFDLSALSFTVPGTYTLTATSGNLTEAIATIVVTVDFTIAVSPGTPGSANVPPGAPAAYAFTLAPASGVFSSPITLTATGLPAGASYSFSPAAVTPGTSSVASALTIQTVRGASLALRRQTGVPWGKSVGTLALGLLLLPLSASRRMRAVFRRSSWMSIVLVLLALGLSAGLTGCGAGGLFGQPQQTFTIVVTGTSGSLSHSATVTLTVQ